LAGGVLEAFKFAGTGANPGVVPLCRNGFNDRGQVAFWFRLESKLEGVAIWSPEENNVPQFEAPTIIRETPTQFRASFSGIKGIPYKIETIDDLVNGTWNEVTGPHFVNSEGVSETIFDLAALTFFRLVFAR
jgi:hypothetical protein